MALSVFGKTLTARPTALKPRVGPPQKGQILNRIPALTRPLFAKLPTPLSGDRATHPVPGTPASAAPRKFVSRAIDNANAVIRKPDRGAANVLQGAVLTMPDGTSGGAPVTPSPIHDAMGGVFRQVVAGGGNNLLRQTQVTTLQRESYLQRQRDRVVTASIGKMLRGNFIQRQGMAYVGRPIPSTIGALDKAQLWRRKFGTPTGIQGDRATMYPTSHIGAVYTKTNAPLDVNVAHTDTKIGGTGTTIQPIPNGVNVLASPTTKTEAIGKAYAWAPADASSSTPASSTSTLAQGGERWALLIGVAVLGFLLIKKL